MNIFEHKENVVVPVVQVRFEGNPKTYDFINEIPDVSIGDTVAVKTVGRGFQIARVYGIASKGRVREGAYIAAVLSKDHKAKLDWWRQEQRRAQIDLDIAVARVPKSTMYEALAAVDDDVATYHHRYLVAKEIVAAHAETTI